MTLREKYQPVLQLVKDYAAEGGEIWEEDGMLHILASVETTYERDVIREKIVELSGDVPPDLTAEIEVWDPNTSDEDPEEAGETMRRVANRYYPRPDLS